MAVQLQRSRKSLERLKFERRLLLDRLQREGDPAPPPPKRSVAHVEVDHAESDYTSVSEVR
jgi:hypothetical protein